MAAQLFPFLETIKPIKEFMLKLAWYNDLEVKDIKLPMLFVSGSADTFVPTWMTHKLFGCATQAKFKDILIIEGGEHNNTFVVGGHNYFNKVEEFIQK